MTKPRASVIIINWNGKAHLERCLESLRKQIYADFEIIIVDNGSTDGSVEFIIERYGNGVRLIKNEKNLGFAEGNNVGFRNARGEFFITLNNDTEVDCGWLGALVSAAEGDDKIGMCASKILFLERPNIIDSVGMNIFFDGMSKQRGHLEADRGQYNSLEEILLPSACAALYRKKMLDEIGFFDKDFFIYCDDTDLGFRARLAGWKAVFVPSSVVYHVYSATMGAYSSAKAYLVERNHYWFAFKTFPLRLLLLLPFFTLLRILTQAKSVLFYSEKKNIRAGSFDKLGVMIAILKAYAAVVVSLPSVLRKRRSIRSIKKVSDSQILSWFERFGLNINDLKLNRAE